LRAIAVQHHERLDGSGYPRALSGDALTPAGRILAAADAYHAMTEPRPHRPARSAAEAAGELRAGGRGALFDADAVDAVLRAAGHRVKQPARLAGGLTNREVEVLRLLVRGLSYREIAEELVISQRTAGSHVEHIYAKIGVPQSRPGQPLRDEARPHDRRIGAPHARSDPPSPEDRGKSR
jgi:HD-GYP domain-containing protein (c-di-GMP phosphodiesterase class II)